MELRWIYLFFLIQVGEIFTFAALEILFVQLLKLYSGARRTSRRGALIKAVADPGAPPAPPAPHGSRFFRFDIQIFRNVAASGVDAPLRDWHPPYRKSGSVTARELSWHQSRCSFLSNKWSKKQRAVQGGFQCYCCVVAMSFQLSKSTIKCTNLNHFRLSSIPCGVYWDIQQPPMLF